MSFSIGLITLNAKFIHSALGLRYLRNAARRAGHENVWLREYTINQPLWKIVADIQKHKPDILGISVYIWNRTPSLELVEILQKQNPELKIVLGGPEISFEQTSIKHCTLIAGEGENKWVEYLDLAQKNQTPDTATLTRWTTYGSDLPELHTAYIDEDLPILQNRYAYLEASRGCPFLCSFCLSALDEKVRYFDESALDKQIDQLAQAGVNKFKFVDRTFNLNPKRVKRLLDRLKNYEGKEFHFEVVGDLLDDSMLDYLDEVPPGRFQFEIGVQTTSEATNTLIKRKQNNEKLFQAIKRLVLRDHIHLHCDLLFGLPGESLEDIWKSFNTMVKLYPHELQLGFLKFLPGSPILELIEPYEYKFGSFPPYEIISNKDLSPEDILYLKQFNEVFDLFYNSKRFQFSLKHQLKNFQPVQTFQKLTTAYGERTGWDTALSLDHQYRLFRDTFSPGNDPLAQDLLKLDYLYHQRTFRLPDFLRISPETGEPGKTFTWRKDRKTPVVPFRHEISISAGEAKLIPSNKPIHYAIAHPSTDSGYLNSPEINRVEEINS